MGSPCSSRRRRDLEFKDLKVVEFTQETFVRATKKQKKTQLEPTVELWLKLIELIDTRHSFSKELLTNLNDLIITRTDVLFSLRKPLSNINDYLSQSVKIVRSLEGNEEFEYYFPILSISFYTHCLDMEIYLRHNSNNSTKCNSQCRLPQHDT